MSGSVVASDWLAMAPQRVSGCRHFGDTECSLLFGDAEQVLRVMPDDAVDLIFADPPYNIGKRFAESDDRWPTDAAYVQWCQGWLSECLRVLSPRGSLYLMTSTQAMPYLDIWLRERISIQSRIVWHYDSSGVQAKKRFGSLYEPILHCVADPKEHTFDADAVRVEARTGAQRKLIDYRKSTPAPYAATKVPGNVWYFPRVRYRMAEYEEHPSQKPESLLERVLLASSRAGDLVLDPFAGTFTTGAVARRLERRFVGIERERQYVKTGLRRLGLASRLDGEELVPLQKNYARVTGAT